jgi:hypothetical protein
LYPGLIPPILPLPPPRIFPNDVVAGKTRHKNQFGMEAAAPMALMLTRMLTVTLSEGYCQLHGTLPYIFLHRTHPTTNTQQSINTPDPRCGNNDTLAKYKVPSGRQ